MSVASRAANMCNSTRPESGAGASQGPWCVPTAPIGGTRAPWPIEGARSQIGHAGARLDESEIRPPRVGSAAEIRGSGVVAQFEACSLRSSGVRFRTRRSRPDTPSLWCASQHRRNAALRSCGLIGSSRSQRRTAVRRPPAVTWSHRGRLMTRQCEYAARIRRARSQFRASRASFDA